jgi:hypothetical protein
MVVLLLLLLLGFWAAAAAEPEALAGSNRSDTSVECSLVSGVTCKQQQQQQQQCRIAEGWQSMAVDDHSRLHNNA